MNRKNKIFKQLICILLSFSHNYNLHSENLDSILQVLDLHLLKKEFYESRYINKSDSLRILAEEEDDQQKRLIRWKEVLDFEFSRNRDKALYASDKVIYYAQHLKNIPEEVNAIQLQAIIYGMGGLPWEGKSILDSLLKNKRLSPLITKQIYTHYYNLYDYFYAYKLPDKIRERNASFLSHITNTVQGNITNPAIKAMTFNSSAIGEEQAILHLKNLLDSSNLDKGVIATTISNKYLFMRDIVNREYYLALASIYNIKSARHENEALIRLAERMVEKNDWQRASKYLAAAYDDAQNYNSNSRLLEILPIMNKILKKNKEINTKQSEQIYNLHIICSVLGGLLILTFFICCKIYIRLRHEKNNWMKKQETSQLLVNQMQDEIALKNEYVTKFLELSLDSILQIEQIRKTILIKINSGETEQLKNKLSKPNLSNDFQNECLQRFDIAFLRLYPNFTKRINDLLRPEEKIELSSTEIMNNEFRILAFMKLGIIDSVRVATILGVSVNTIYFYRNKLRRKAINRSSFEDDVLQISDFGNG